MRELLILIYVAIPLACWPLVSRSRTVKAIVMAILATLGAAVLLLGLGVLYVHQRLDLAAAYIPAASAVIGGALVLEWRSRRGEPPSAVSIRRRVAGGLLAIYLAGMLCCGIPLFALIWNGDGYVPSSKELLPLPAGLTVISNQDEGCGSASCTRAITVGSRTNLTPQQVAARVRQHLNHADGWHLDANMYACRRQGWLIDQTSLCVQIDVRSPVTVWLTGSRAGSD